MEYKQITAKVLHDEVDLVSCAMIEAGSEGVSVADGNDVKEVITGAKNWDYYDKSLDNVDLKYAFVTGFYAVDYEVSRLGEVLREYLDRDVELTASVCEEFNWEKERNKYYKPIDFGKLVVVPKWLDGEYDKPKILIDPGMAFGTGLHESTSMCIDLLSNIDVSGKRVLDVGCGSGILGIAAIKLGASDCTLIDIDEQAVTATKSNLALNGLTANALQGDLAEKYEGQADVVLANLTADILLRLKPSLGTVAKTGGTVIVSGIINERADDVVKGFTEEGEFAVIKNERKGEWQAFAFEKK